MSKRVEITEHCETMGNCFVTLVAGTRFTAGKTSLVFVSYWYVKYVRENKPDVVLFTNPMDWLRYMESLAPLNAWKEGGKSDYSAENPTLTRMQYLTQAVENGNCFTWLGMRIWAYPTEAGSGQRYRYCFSIGEKVRCFGTKGAWRTAIKPYLWDWQPEKDESHEQSA